MITLALQSVNVHAAHKVTAWCAVSACVLAFVFEGLHALHVCLLMLHCSMAHVSLFVGCYITQKHIKFINTCSSVLSKCDILSFFCLQVKLCCESAIPFVPNIIWKVTYLHYKSSIPDLITWEQIDKGFFLKLSSVKFFDFKILRKLKCATFRFKSSLFLHETPWFSESFPGKTGIGKAKQVYRPMTPGLQKVMGHFWIEWAIAVMGWAARRDTWVFFYGGHFW